MMLSMQQFAELFSKFERTAFRIETLPVYSVDGERDRLAGFLDGELLPPDSNEQWAQQIASSTAAGKKFARVHVIDHNISPYIRFEIEYYYVFNCKAGEDIRFVFREDVKDLTYTDTWLFDDSIVVDMSYTESGELLYINHNEHPKRLEDAQHAWTEMFARSFDLKQLLRMVRAADLKI